MRSDVNGLIIGNFYQKVILIYSDAEFVLPNAGNDGYGTRYIWMMLNASDAECV